MSEPRTLEPPGSSPEATGTSRRNLLRTFRMSTIGTAVSYAVNLAILPVVLHRIGPDVYGAWVTVASLLMIGALADAGIRTEVVRRVAAARGADDSGAVVNAVHEGVTLLACSAGVLLVIGLAGAPLIRRFAFPSGVAGLSAGGLDMLVRATVALLFVTVVGNAYFAVLRGVQRGDIESLAQLVAVPVGAAVTVAGVVWGWGLWAMLAGSSAQLLLFLAWQAAGTRRVVPELRLRLVRVSATMARGFLGLSGLALLAQVGDVVDSQWDKIVLSRYVGSRAVTSFQIGTGLALQGKAVALLVLAPLMAAVAEWRLGRPERLDQLSDTLARGAMVVSAVVLGGIVVFAPAFIRLWLSDLDGSAAHAARLFVIAVVVNVVGAPMVLRALGEGWHRLVAVGALVNMAVNAFLSLVLTMAWGFDGALYGSIAGNVVGTIGFLLFMRRRMGARWTPPPVAALAVGVGATVAATRLGLDEVDSWPTLVAAAVGYAAVVGVAATLAERLHPRDLLPVATMSGSASAALRRLVRATTYRALGPLAARQEQLALAIGRMEARTVRSSDVHDLRDAEFRVFSQWGEDGIIQYLLSKVPIERTVFVEFGVEDYREANTRFLLQNDHWQGLILDCGTDHIRFLDEGQLRWRYSIEARSAFLDRDNINTVIADGGVTGDIGLLSIDVDGNDYWLWEAIDVVSPRILVVEYNSLFGSKATVTVPYRAEFDRLAVHWSGLCYGASLAALDGLCRGRGYRLVGCNRAGNNAFFVRDDVAGDLSSRTVDEAFVQRSHRESRGRTGKLTYVTDHAEQLRLMADGEVVDVRTGERGKVADLVLGEG